MSSVEGFSHKGHEDTKEHKDFLFNFLCAPSCLCAFVANVQ